MRSGLVQLVAVVALILAWGGVALAEDVPGGVGVFDHGNQYAWIFAFVVLVIVGIPLLRSYRRMQRQWRQSVRR